MMVVWFSAITSKRRSKRPYDGEHNEKQWPFINSFEEAIRKKRQQPLMDLQGVLDFFVIVKEFGGWNGMGWDGMVRWYAAAVAVVNVVP